MTDIKDIKAMIDSGLIEYVGIETINNIIDVLMDVYPTYKARVESGIYLNINTAGNRKLKNTNKVRFIIYNLPAIKTCPFATELCKKSCYARKAEYFYPDALPCREHNYQDTLSGSFTFKMIFTIRVELDRPRANKGKKIIFRIHESGDFYSFEYAKKWLDIINYFKDVKNLVFMAYTKSLPFFEGVKIPDNLSFIASVWADTNPEMLALIEKNNYRVYTAVESFKDFKGFKCKCSDCAKCQGCINNKVSVIACEIH